MRPAKSKKIKKAIYIIACLLFTFNVCDAVSPPYASKEEKPWFTGPIITPSARVVPQGHINLEPYAFWTEVNGVYDNNWHASSIEKFYSINTLLVAKFGIADRINLSIVPQSVYNHSHGHSESGFADLPIGIEYQLISPDESKFPLKLSVQEIFPIARFDELDRENFGTDLIGAGSYTTTIGLTVSNLHHFQGDNYLQTRLNCVFGVPAPFEVSGINVFGGDPTTNGKVFPGVFGIMTFGAEYSLTKNWVLALDLVGQIYGRDRFKGETILPVGLPTFVQFIAAPAIEYNFNEDVGIIVGSTFTFAGKNAPRFYNIVAALNWFF